jgi:pimeloyl-ACP methyl ester carboxylesterase
MSVFWSTLQYLLTDFWCKLTHGIRPLAPAKPDFSDWYRSDYTLKTDGDCQQGSYLEIYIPTQPFLGDNHTPKAVIYLHGFDLGASQIYRAHLLHLVRQGFYVIYPNFQKGFCEFPDSQWQTVKDLIDETIDSGWIAPQAVWMQAALNGAKQAYDGLGFIQAPVDTYLFGHSLGGLFALSWAYYVQKNQLPDSLIPRQVVAADPVPDTGFYLRGVLGQYLDPFIDAVDIRVTGAALTMPTAILHGNDDAIAPKHEWKQLFQAIAADHKRMYLSYTDQRGCPALYANHEQATEDTSFVSTVLSLLVLDGVGSENTLNWRYVWAGLDQVIRDGVRADQLTFDLGSWSDGKPVHPIEEFLP